MVVLSVKAKSAGFLAWMSALAEFGGGLLLAIVFAHAGDPYPDREKPRRFFFIALFLLLAGPGRYSLDSLIRGRRG